MARLAVAFGGVAVLMILTMGCQPGHKTKAESTEWSCELPVHGSLSALDASKREGLLHLLKVADAVVVGVPDSYLNDYLEFFNRHKTEKQKVLGFASFYKEQDEKIVFFISEKHKKADLCPAW